MTASHAPAQITMTKRQWKVPEGWKWMPLSKVCKSIIGGGTPKRSHPEFFGGEIVWITPSDLNMGDPTQKIITSRNTITKHGLQASSAKMVPAGTVLFSSRATIGKIGIADVPLCTNQGFANFVCGEHLDNKYLAWSLYALTDEIKELAGSTTYREVSRGNLSSFTIPLPYPEDPTVSLSVQRRIVARIESLMEDVEESRKLLDKIRQDADQVVDNTLRASIDDLYRRYNVEPLGPHIDHITSGPRNWGKYVHLESNGPLFIRVGNVGFARIELDNTVRLNLPQNAGEQRTRVKPGDVLVTITGTIGRCCVIPDDIGTAYVNQHVAIIRLKSSLIPRYLMWCVLSPSGGGEQIALMQYGQTKPGLNLTNIKDLQVPVPPKPVQLQLVSHLDFMLEEVREILDGVIRDEKLINQVEQSILECAFRGEL